MNEKLNKALCDLQTNYVELVEVANDMIKDVVAPANELVDRLSSNVNNLSIDQLRDYILQLQLTAYGLSEIKEKSAMKAQLADAIYKERYAIEFNKAEGSATAKGNIALTEVSAETASEVLFNLIASLLKTKLDQLHRLTDCLKSVLMSRMQETKFMNIGTTAEVPNTVGNNGHTILNE